MPVRTTLFSKHMGNIFPILIIAGVGLVLSSPALSQPLPGVDAPMHLSKISRLWTFFPSLPMWFPWWYCGIPLLKTYPPLMYWANILVIALFRLESWLALGVIDTMSFVLTGCFIYLFLRKIGLHELACLSSSILYLSSFQTLSGRFGYGHYSHTFAMLFLVFGIYLAAKTHSSKYYEICIASVFCLLVLSNLYAAISFVGLLFTYYVGVLFAKAIDARNEQNHIFPFFKSLFGGTIGVLLASFWFIPYLMVEGSRTAAFMSSTTAYVLPLQSLFLFDSQNILLLQSYYLGVLLIGFGALGLFISLYRRVFWGIIFTSWTFFFLFMCIQPYIFQGLSLGYPARYPFFVSFSMSLLSAVFFNLLLKRFARLFSKLHVKILFRSAFVLLLVSCAVYVDPVIIKAYEPENRVSEELNSYLSPFERLASISTFSYTFNVLSNHFQIDGGYIEGNINMELYRRYWSEIYSGDDVEATIDILKRINARLVLFYGQISPQVESKFVPPYFSAILKKPPTTVFELNRTLVPLNFIEVISGNEQEVILSYMNPDILEFELKNCSVNTELVVKMNYHEGWIAYCNEEVVSLVKNDDGFMNLFIPFDGDVKMKMHYSHTELDSVGIVTTGLGILLLLYVTKSEWVHEVFRRLRIRLSKRTYEFMH
ncbi:MAG: hypothetical protein JSV51_04500 [Candidatus Bathyarchaeota archaeon]|nr:MAG: hypothetical protein JSV51_04500 [Candidatus Bathyarchaeota archaeon]